MATYDEITKHVAGIQALQSTGINLVGREFGKTNNGSLFRDASAPLVEICIFPGRSEVYRWGKVREYGNKRSSLVIETKDGRLLWLQEKDQDGCNLRAFRKLCKDIGVPSSPSNRAISIKWVS